MKETAVIVLLLLGSLLITLLFGCGMDINPMVGNGQCQGVQTNAGATLYCPGQDPLYISNGQTGVQGPQGVTGQAGSDGAVGSQGLPGQVGPQGSPGEAGSQGTAGTSISIVQLCPTAAIAQYPNVFTEVAMCIDGQLYGVYSANGGFLSLLPPGIYVSNGIGSTCIVMIGPNCEITN